MSTMIRKIDDKLLLEMYNNGKGKSQTDLAEYFGCSNAAICKRLKKLIVDTPESFSKLTEKEKKFVLAKAEGKTNIEAVMGSYDVTTRDSAKSLGTTLMKDPDINTAIADIMAQEGLSRRYRIQKLKKLVDHQDPTASARGLDMSFKIAGDYQPEIVIENNDHDIIINDIQKIDAEIARLKRELSRVMALD